MVVIERQIGAPANLRALITPEKLKEMQAEVDQVYVDPVVISYAARIVSATRTPAEHGLAQHAEAIQFGGSPRASINLVLGARALAYIRGRSYVLPQDVTALAHDVLRHRLVLTYEGLAAGTTADTIIDDILKRFPPIRLDLGDRHVA
jgi:MoxR-like ATPase